MRYVRAFLGVLLTASLVAQSDRGTITGTVTDPAGAVVANAPLQFRNVETGANYQVATTDTGNYTVANLPAGTYEMSVSVPGFKTYLRQNVAVQVAQVLRIDVPLEVGQSTESVTISAEVTLLRTESSDVSTNVQTERMNNLPILGIGAAGAGSQGVRNPMAAATLSPGVYLTPNNRAQVNGAPGNTMSIRVEGQEATNGVVTFAQAETQPSVDAIQEVAVQASNFAAEFGQAGGGIFNYTMKSGTNSYHGTAYEYYVNEALNAGQPYLNTRPRQRRHDFGGTIGGPIRIPGIYDGRDKSFFFFNYERFREGVTVNNITTTVPTAALRTGDFSSALTNRTLTGFVDPLGNTPREGQIFDPASEQLINGQRVRSAFPGNVIPASRIDPVAQKIQALIPNPTGTGLFSNGFYPYNSVRNSPIPALKLDHYFNTAHKVSFYWSSSETAVQYCTPLCGSEGFPDAISQTRGTFIEGWTTRLNYDWTLNPTTLLHLGAGFASNDFKDTAPITNFDAVAAFGLRGATINRQAPRFTALLGPNNSGGVSNLGPFAQSRTRQAKPTFIASLNQVRGNHSLKFGGELRIEGYPAAAYTGTGGIFDFNTEQTTNTALQGRPLNGLVFGHNYASFLLGLPNTVTLAAPANSRGGFTIWGLYAQDTWKMTRKLTLDYGLRWDYFTYPREQYGRTPTFRSDIANPAANGALGGVIFEASCNCRFANNYKAALGPRLGVAYQINSKTVLRAGFGVNYFGSNAGSQGGAGASQTLTNPNFGDAPMQFSTGIPFQPTWPRLIPDLFNPNGSIATNGAVTALDQNAGRPARQAQWSIGIQREISRNLVLDVAYVGNRGVWWAANNLVEYNALQPSILSSVYGLNVNNPADQAILRARVSDAAAGRFRNVVPYADFPTSETVAQALRPFPHFRNIAGNRAPNGKTWYDGLQTKLTKRFSQGLDFTWSFSYQKELTLGANADNGGGAGLRLNDIFNRNTNKQLQPFSRPFVSVFAANYRLPKLNINRAASWAIRDWQIGTVLQWASGLPIAAPNSNGILNNLILRPTYAERVPGQPMFLADINGDSDPTRTLYFNPAAWREPGGSTASGQFAASAGFFNDYRGRRIPQESMSFGRIFPLGEGKSFQVRAEWTNIFNRLLLNNPTGAATTNYQAATQRNADGSLRSGFGFINTLATAPNPGVRQGTIVVRFRF